MLDALKPLAYILRLSVQMLLTTCLILLGACSGRETSQNIGPHQTYQCFLPVQGIREPGKAQRANYLSDGRVLVNAEGLLDVLQPRAQTFEPVDIPQPPAGWTAWESLELHDHRVFLWANNSAYILPAGSTRATPAMPAPFNGQIHDVLYTPDGTVAFHAGNGFYVLPNGASGVKQVAVLPAGWSVFNMKTLSNGDIMVVSSSGWFKIQPGTNQWEKVVLSDPSVTLDGGLMSSKLSELKDGRILFHGKESWYRMKWPSGELQQIKSKDNPSALQIVPYGNGGALLQTIGGFVSLQGGDDEMRAVVIARDAKLDMNRQVLSNGGLLITTTNGLYWLAPGSLSLEPVDPTQFTALASFYAVLKDGRVLGGNNNGEIYLVSPSIRKIERIATPVQPERQAVVELPDGRVLLGGDQGLFVLRPNDLTIRPVISVTTTGPVSTIRRLPSGRLLLASTNGVFLFSMDEPVSLSRIATPSDGDVRDYVYDIRERPNGQLATQANKGMRLSATDSFESTQIEFPDLPNHLSLNEPLTLWIRIAPSQPSSPCAAFLPAWQPRLRVSPLGSTLAATKYELTRFQDGKFDASHTFTSQGSYSLQLIMDGTRAAIGNSATIVAGGDLDWIKMVTEYTVSAFFVLHLVIVFSLLYRSRKSAESFRLLQDPFWAKAAIYSNFLIRNSRKVQLWLLDRYMAEAAAEQIEQGPDPYEPLPLMMGKGGPCIPGDVQILDHLSKDRRAWISGRAGMGKTALVRMLARTFFLPDEDRSHDAFAAYQRCGAVLLFIQANRFEPPASDPNAPQRWVTDAAASQLAHFHLDFADKSIVHEMLHNGTLGLVIDGIDEVNKEDNVATFAFIYPRTLILVTSQGKPKSPFNDWRLPATVQEHIGKLLHAHMGAEDGARLENILFTQHAALLDTLLSGYDVRLLVDLARQNPANPQLPTSRAGLYDLMLAQAPADYPRSELGALAWSMWINDQRELPDTPAVVHRLVTPLDGLQVTVFRRSQARCEFRHDQMRAYLAAHWLVEQGINLTALTLRLKEDAVWRVAARDQEEVWAFVATLLPIHLLSPLWNFCLESESRVRLQHAIQRAAEAGHAPLSVSPSAQRTTH